MLVILSDADIPESSSDSKSGADAIVNGVVSTRTLRGSEKALKFPA